MQTEREKALFFFYTVHGALLFLSQREKEEGGAKNFVSFSKESNAKTPVFVKRTQIHPLRFVKNRVGKSAQTGLTNTMDYSIL